MTLTRESLLAMKPEATKVEVEGFGTVYMKPLTEFQRSKRLADLYGENNDKQEDAKLKFRINLIIDQVCDERCKPLFNEGDAKDLLAIEGSKLDALVNAISDFNDGLPQEKNE